MRRTNLLRVAAPGLALAITLVSPSVADELLVRPDGTGDYATIQLAVDAATPGDVILLADGLYRGVGNAGVVLRGADLTLRSVSGLPTACVIDANGLGRAMRVEAGVGNTVQVLGIAFTGGMVPESMSGGNVHCQSAITFENCLFVGGTAGSGGGVAVAASARFVSCAFVGNQARLGAAVAATAVPRFEDCHFVDNVVGDVDGPGASGGAVYATGPGTRVRIDRSSLVGTVADGPGAVATFRAAAGATFVVRRALIERGEGSLLSVDAGSGDALELMCTVVDGTLAVPDDREVRCAVPGALPRDDLASGRIAWRVTGPVSSTSMGATTPSGPPSGPPSEPPSAFGSTSRPDGRSAVTLRAQPNPFRGVTRFQGSYTVGEWVELAVFDVSGRPIWRHRSERAPHSLVWDGVADSGRRVAPGTYFARIVTDGGSTGVRLVLLP